MNVPSETPVTDPPAPKRVDSPACLETDHFCEGCGYNLHGQTVTRDERLGFMVCRCPECGRFHPANSGTTAGRVWLRRIATFLVVAWVLFIGACALGAFATFAGLAWAHLVEHTTWEQQMLARLPPRYPPGRYSTSTYGYYVQRRVLRSELRSRFGPLNYYNDSYGGFTFPQLLAAASLAAGFVTGAFFAVALWHVRRPRRRLWTMLLPIAGGAVVLGLWCYNPENQGLLAWAVGWVALYAAIQATALGMGLAMGRPLARWVTRVVPPRPRQALAFLWRADGLEPPGVKP